MSKWSKLLAKFVQSDDDQVEVIWALQDYCEKDGKEKFKAVFPLILHQLYDAEIVAEDSVWKWVEEQKGAPDQTFITLVIYLSFKIFVTRVISVREVLDMAQRS